MSQAVDFSFSHPAPGDIPGGGFVGALRYFTRAGAPKRLVKSELDELEAADVPVAGVFEDAADRALGGAAAGDADGAETARQIADIGWGGKFVYAAVDFAPRPDQYPALDAYFDAFGNHFRVEPYGDYDYIEHWCATKQVTVGGWQTAAWSGMGEGSGGSIDGRRVSSCARLYQRVGYVLNNTSDANDIRQADWGQWPTQGDDDMTKDELLAVLRAEGVSGAADPAHNGANAILAAVAGITVDPAKVASALAPLLNASAQHLSQADLDAIKTAVADEEARRLAG